MMQGNPMGLLQRVLPGHQAAQRNPMMPQHGTPPNPMPRPGMGLLGGQPTPQQEATQTRGPGMFGGAGDFLRNNSSTLMGLGAGILERGLAGGPSGAFQGQQMDRERRTQTGQQNATVQALRQMRPDMSQEQIDALVQSGNTALLSEALRPPAQPQLPSRARLALEAGLERGTPEYSQFLMGGDPQTNVTVNNGGDSAAMERIGESIVDESAEAIAAGQSAARTQQSLNELEQLLASAPQGMAGGVTAMANGLGIAVEGGDEVAAAQAILNQLAPQQRPEGSGPMSDADLRLFQASLPRIINQPGGNQIILRGMQALNQYDQARGQIAAQYQDMILREVPQQEAARFYREQMNQLNAQTPSLGQMIQQAGVQASQPSQRGSRLEPSGNGRVRYVP